MTTDLEQVGKQGPPPTIPALIQSMRGEIQRALPAHLSGDRLARIALTVVRRNPDLAACTHVSFAGALLEAASLGLEVGPTGEAYLVPYEHKRGPLRGQTECQLILGYKGLAKLFWQFPSAQRLDAQAVRERDDFDWAYGTASFLRHKPARGDRGAITDYYAVAGLSTGGSQFVVLSPEEVKVLRRGNVGPKGDIPDPQHWMERKTVLKQCLKTLPKSVNLARAIEHDETGGTVLYQQHVAEVGAEREHVAELTGQPAQDYTPKLTGKLRAHLFARFGELGISDRDQQLDRIADAIGRRPEHRDAITDDEARRVIASLEEKGTDA